MLLENIISNMALMISDLDMSVDGDGYMKMLFLRTIVNLATTLLGLISIIMLVFYICYYYNKKSERAVYLANIINAVITIIAGIIIMVGQFESYSYSNINILTLIASAMLILMSVIVLIISIRHRYDDSSRKDVNKITKTKKKLIYTGAIHCIVVCLLLILIYTASHMIL